MQIVIATKLATIDMEPAKLDMPVSPPHFSVNIGQSADTGEKTTSARICRVTSEKGERK